MSERLSMNPLYTPESGSDGDTSRRSSVDDRFLPLPRGSASSLRPLPGSSPLRDLPRDSPLLQGEIVSLRKNALYDDEKGVGPDKAEGRDGARASRQVSHDDPMSLSSSSCITSISLPLPRAHLVHSFSSDIDGPHSPLPPPQSFDFNAGGRLLDFTEAPGLLPLISHPSPAVPLHAPPSKIPLGPGTSPQQRRSSAGVSITSGGSSPLVQSLGGAHPCGGVAGSGAVSGDSELVRGLRDQLALARREAMVRGSEAQQLTSQVGGMHWHGCTT